MKKITIKDIALIGIMAAAVYVASAFLQIPIPTAIGSTRLHMGNVMCLLSGMLLGATPGGFAAGIGSMFFDLTNLAYITSAPFTFAFKFVMAWLCGEIISKYAIGLKTRFLGGAITGALCAIIHFKKFYRRPLHFGAAIRSCYAYCNTKKCCIQHKRYYCSSSFGTCITHSDFKFSKKIMKLK